MSRGSPDARLEHLVTLLEEVTEDNTAVVAELKRLHHAQQAVGVDVERAVDQLRGDLVDGLTYRALKDLCQELIGPLTAIEAMLAQGGPVDPAVMTGHSRSLCVSLRGVLSRMGAERVQVIAGEDRYDPRVHRCVGVVDPGCSPYPDAPPQTVVRVVEDGYLLDHRLLAPARVEIQSGRPTHR